MMEPGAPASVAESGRTRGGERHWTTSAHTRLLKMAATRAAPAWRIALAKWAYNKSYFPQLGLMRDDCLEQTAAVKEALRRVPPQVYDARQFRISRALHLSNKKMILPKEEWTKFEEDVQYLKPLIEKVEQEMLEKSEWDSR